MTAKPETDLLEPVSAFDKAELLRHVGSYMPDFEDIVRRLCAQHDLMRAALEPFAQAGALFLPADESDTSAYVTEADEAPIGDRLVWETTPLTIGHLRAARLALGKNVTEDEHADRF